MRFLPGRTTRRCLSCGKPRLQRKGVCDYCGSETQTIEVDDTDDSTVNREHWGFE